MVTSPFRFDQHPRTRERLPTLLRGNMTVAPVKGPDGWMIDLICGGLMVRLSLDQSLELANILGAAAVMIDIIDEADADPNKAN